MITKRTPCPLNGFQFVSHPTGNGKKQKKVGWDAREDTFNESQSTPFNYLVFQPVRLFKSLSQKKKKNNASQSLTCQLPDKFTNNDSKHDG